MSRAKVDGSSSPAFLDDTEREPGRNALPAKADPIAKIVTGVNQATHAGQPLFTWVMRGIGSQPAMRQVLSTRNLAVVQESGVTLYLTHQFDPDGNPGFQTGQGINVRVDSTDYLTPISYDDVVDTVYPTDLRVQTFTALAQYSTTLKDYVISSTTTNYPQLRAGGMWQTPMDTALTGEGTSVVGKSDLHIKGDIIGARSSSNEDLSSLRDVFNNTFTYKRPQFGWSALAAGTSSFYIGMTTSFNAYRYIFDQTYGTGGTSFTATTPAWTLPLSYSAAGRRTQVRVYVFVYAAMSGATNTGSLAVANKNSSGTMASSATALTNTPTINSTTFRWYPTLSSFDPSTAPYFLAYAGSTYDRVALCSRSSGTTDSVRIGAVTMIVQHDTT